MGDLESHGLSMSNLMVLLNIVWKIPHHATIGKHTRRKSLLFKIISRQDFLLQTPSGIAVTRKFLNVTDAIYRRKMLLKESLLICDLGIKFQLLTKDTAFSIT